MSIISKRTNAIGVVLPVHNEELRIASALSAIRVAFHHPSVIDYDRYLVIVLDSCDDGTAQIVKRWKRRHFADRCSVIESGSANVGVARQMGCASVLSEWESLDRDRIWIATTDADSEVPPDWLAVQLARHDAGYDLWAGRVTVRDWSPRSARTASEWSLRYADEVAPIHGANLGFNAGAYLEAGGFQPLPTGEDRALHGAIATRSHYVCHDRLAPVVTSARRHGRAPRGFAYRLDSIEVTGSIEGMLARSTG